MGVVVRGDYIFVLEKSGVAIFTCMGILIKKCSIPTHGTHVSLHTAGELLVITRCYNFLLTECF